jgi:hypothetical protein
MFDKILYEADRNGYYYSQLIFWNLLILFHEI